MIDLALLRTDPDLVRRTVWQRGADVDVDRLVGIDDELRQAVARSGAVRAQLRRHAMRRDQVDADAIQALKDEMAAVTEEVRALQDERDELWGRLPNLLAPDTPAGSVELRRAGDPVAGDAARHHDAVGAALGILAREAPGADSGLSSWHGPSWRADGTRLAWAVFTHAQQVLHARGFTPLLLPPARPLLGCYLDQIIDVAELPLRLCGFSPGSRAVAAAAPDRDEQRTYQVEQVVLCRAEDAAHWLDECQRNAEDLLRDLELPYRVVRVGAGELDPAAYQAYGTESWFPGSGAYLRTHTTSHCTDYQARRFKIRYLERGRVTQPDTVVATAVTERAVLAVLENHAQPDGSVRVPEALRRYLGGQELIEPSPPAG